MSDAKLDIDLFQFQLGAIGRVEEMVANGKIWSVSIPAWCDWE